MLCRLVSGRDGVDLLTSKYPQIIKYMISSFKKYSNEPQVSEARFLIYLLETMGYILQFDKGIEFFVGSGIMKRCNELLLK